MKKLIILLFLFVTVVYNSTAQKVATVTITTKSNIVDAFDKCKEAGKKAGYGSKDYETDESKGKVTLWRNTGAFLKTELFIEITATYKDGVSTLLFKMPHNPKVMANYPHEIKKVTAKIKMTDMLVGEYFDGIE